MIHIQENWLVYFIIIQVLLLVVQIAFNTASIKVELGSKKFYLYSFIGNFCCGAIITLTAVVLIFANLN